MADPFDQTGPISVASTIGRWMSAFVRSKVGPSLLFGLRLWTAVCLALFVAFWLELYDPFWAGASAAVVPAPARGFAAQGLVSNDRNRDRRLKLNQAQVSLNAHVFSLRLTAM
jgi:hypothetical protein